jgi:mono/diheme cytochrome c family protein
MNKCYCCLVVFNLFVTGCYRENPSSDRASRILTNIGRSSSRALSTAPNFFPSFVSECKQFDDLGRLMGHNVLTGMGVIEEAIETSEGSLEERLDSVARGAGVLLGCVPSISRMTEDMPAQDWNAFDLFLYDYQKSILGLQVSAVDENAQMEDVEHWFAHVEITCQTCHARFWDEKKGVLEADTKNDKAEDLDDDGFGDDEGFDEAEIEETGNSNLWDLTKLDAKNQARQVIFAKKCSRCHELTRAKNFIEQGSSAVSGESLSEKSVNRIVLRMKRKPGSGINYKTAKEIADYLNHMREKFLQSR